jgi:hypothetical protein
MFLQNEIIGNHYIIVVDRGHNTINYKIKDSFSISQQPK